MLFRSQYRAWGIEGTLEELRVRAFLDLLTDRDPRKTQPRTRPGKGRKARPGTPHGDGHTSPGRTGTGEDPAGQDADQAAAGQDPVQDQAAVPEEIAAQDESAGMDQDAWDSLLDDADDETGDDSDRAGNDGQDGDGQDDDGQDDGRDGDDDGQGGGGGNGRGPAEIGRASWRERV